MKFNFLILVSFCILSTQNILSQENKSKKDIIVFNDGSIKKGYIDISSIWRNFSLDKRVELCDKKGNNCEKFKKKEIKGMVKYSDEPFKYLYVIDAPKVRDSLLFKILYSKKGKLPIPGRLIYSGENYDFYYIEAHSSDRYVHSYLSVTKKDSKEIVFSHAYKYSMRKSLKTLYKYFDNCDILEKDSKKKNRYLEENTSFEYYFKIIDKCAG
ncbi:hypothetical protein IMCC3317_10900 [Kordia antarctica]|uniref:Uncharacterized protein n=1 Tax=Kordia antarctica TaxID=1218801 RepID=A0A7L4ZGH0_9FLAO|nr:hypothetical protein [Kordia antarctica]QHI35742.1 hypothetical protein IMCC3317_10900 [Kordia antarctica]